MALKFIVGSELPQMIKNLGKLRKQQFAFTLDFLGETVISEKEADQYVEKYLQLLEHLDQAQQSWTSLGDSDGPLDWGYAAPINVSVKPSALYCLANPLDFDGSVEKILTRLKTVYRKVIQVNGSMCIDMEMHALKDITYELYRRLRSNPEFRDYPQVGLAVSSVS